MPSSSSKRCRRRRSAGIGSDWSLLPDDVLLNVLCRLRTLHDFFSARAVCRDWRNAANYPFLSPKILLVVKRDEVEALYDVVSRRCFDLPRIHPSRHIIGYSHAHLITIPPLKRTGNVHLWNLFTGKKTVLPKLRINYGNIILSGRPDSPHCQVLWFTCGSSILKYLNVGDVSWSVVSEDRMTSVLDMMFFHGEWLALTEDMTLLAVVLMEGTITVREIGGGRVVGEQILLNWWLGESDGVLFVVRRDSGPESEVFRWDPEKMEWEETRDVGDKSLFISMYGDLVLIPATQFGTRKNCVYTTNEESGSWEVFSLDDRSHIRVPGYVPGSEIKFNFWVFPKPC